MQLNVNYNGRITTKLSVKGPSGGHGSQPFWERRRRTLALDPGGGSGMRPVTEYALTTTAGHNPAARALGARGEASVRFEKGRGGRQLGLCQTGGEKRRSRWRRERAGSIFGRLAQAAVATRPTRPTRLGPAPGQKSMGAGQALTGATRRRARGCNAATERCGAVTAPGLLTRPRPGQTPSRGRAEAARPREPRPSETSGPGAGSTSPCGVSFVCGVGAKSSTAVAASGRCEKRLGASPRPGNGPKPATRERCWRRRICQPER